jgi:Rod binding domain-containing protein
MDVSALTIPLNGLSTTGQATAASAAELAKRGQIAKTAQDFEASFLSVMVQSMFEGVKQDEPFSGGQGEEMFKSFMAEAMGKQMAKAGGVGLAASVQREMLKLQGLSQQ